MNYKILVCYVKRGVITTYMYKKKEEVMPTAFATNT